MNGPPRATSYTLDCDSVAAKRLRKETRRLIEYLAATQIDLWRWLTGKTDQELPPLRLRLVGTGDFRKVGEELLAVLIRVGGLRPDHRVLDIGCGVGRVAIPLTRYLQPRATYDGFDVVKRSVRWCRRHITPHHPSFRFHHVHVSNSEYRLRGVSASQFRFPFADQSFDFVFATSVFTHLIADEIRQYLRESARVLAPAGRLLATFFLLNDFSIANLPTRTRFTFPYVSGPMRLLDVGNPGVGVAVEEDVIVDFLHQADLVVEQIAYGQWSGRPDSVSFQDVVVCRRA